MSGNKGFNSFLNDIFKNEPKSKSGDSAPKTKTSADDNILFTPSVSGDKDLMALLSGGGIFKQVDKDNANSAASAPKSATNTPDDRQRGLGLGYEKTTNLEQMQQLRKEMHLKNKKPRDGDNRKERRDAILDSRTGLDSKGQRKEAFLSESEKIMNKRKLKQQKKTSETKNDNSE